MRLTPTLSLVAALALSGCGTMADHLEDDDHVGVAAEMLVNFVGTTTPNGGAPGNVTEDASGFVALPTVRILGPGGHSDPALSVPDQAPDPPPKAIVGPIAGSFGFDGLTHLDQRLAGTGIYENTQFDLEPPDPVVSVGNGFVVEVVNDALAVYDKSGAQLVAPTALNQFFRLPPGINRVTRTFGVEVTDPKIYFDGDTQRFFLTAAEFDLDPVTAAFGPRSRIELAVSQTSDPTGAWFLYTIDVASDGEEGTPSLAGCPCLGDQPLIGADKNGFYISTNEFSVATLEFRGAQIYALSKAALVAGTLPRAVVFANIPVGEGQGFSIEPAVSPPGGGFEAARGGTEYFLSSFLTVELQNKIAVWTLTNTQSLDEPETLLELTTITIPSEIYGLPSPVEQKAGPRPLGKTLLPQLFHAPPEPRERLQTNDQRMQQVFFADGKLWSSLNTVMLSRVDDEVRAGSAYFIVQPCISQWHFEAQVVNQGYIAAGAAESAIFPAVAVNASGRGAIAYTLVGPDFFPSAAYSLLDAENGAGDVHLASAGVAPEDGFTGYRFFGSNGASRWGDYSGGAVDECGSIWMATEYIPNKPRTILANWGTFIANVAP
jgi:hypothetical protein